MPKIYEYFGMVFFFYANEHEPIHVHIKHGENENKVDLLYDNGILQRIEFNKLQNAQELTNSQKADAREFIEKYHLQIVEKWKDFFILHKKPVNEKITKRL